MQAHIACDYYTTHAPDSRADLLNRRHQREGKEHRPEHAVAELRTHLRIRRNSARIVVRSSGNQSRSQLPENRICTRCLVLIGRTAGALCSPLFRHSKTLSLKREYPLRRKQRPAVINRIPTGNSWVNAIQVLEALCCSFA